MTQTVETATIFYYRLKANYFRTNATDLREIFRISSVSGVDNCCEMGLRSLKGRCHGNHFLFNPTLFFVTPIPEAE